MANLNPDSPPLGDILYMLNHVFLPPKLPQEDDTTVKREIALCDLAYRASLEFTPLLSNNQQRQWSSVSRMLKMLLQTTQNLDQHLLQQNILGLGEGGFLALRIRAQNAALIIRRRHDSMVFESFEVQPLPEAVMQAEGKLLCSYPGPAVELPLEIARDASFVEQLASFIVQMDVDKLPGAQAMTVKAGSKVPETRSTAHPRYITQLLSMILLGMGKEAQVNRITKRIADDVCWKNARDPWRRSPLWLLIRVAIQTTVDPRNTYKQFMIFLQMKLLRLFLAHDLRSELLYVTRVKTSRRIYKLGIAASPLLDSMKALSEEIQERLQGRWSVEQKQQAYSPPYVPVPSDFKEHTTLSLHASRTYLAQVMRPNSYTHTSTRFRPSHHARIRDAFDFHDLCPNALTDAVTADSYFALADFEWLVHERLDEWIIFNIHHESACQTLESCLEQYISATRTHYSSSPEDESLMLLTIMELWVALDTIALIQCPLLKSYSPEIPASFLDPLLLRKAKSIERAARIQVYLRRRHSDAIFVTSIYSNQVSETTFSVQYFRQSPQLQVVKNNIKQLATLEREEKCEELQRLNATHAELTREIESLRCENVLAGNHKRKKCPKCKLEKKAASMSIKVHEWPLPKHRLEAEATVFELNCPPAFSIWRRWTYCILRDMGMSRIHVQSDFTPHQLLGEYPPLAVWTWLEDRRTDRITFASEAKSFLKAHYQTVKIPAQEGHVCVKNGLHFKLYDSVKRELARSAFDVDLELYCTLRLQGDGEQSYRGLQYAITYTTRPHNEIIVNQGDCSVNLSMQEQLAFSNLRCGPQLQWMNIARELGRNALTFSREQVHTLITQAAWQIGPLTGDGSTREWHVELEVPEFGHVLIDESMDLLSHVEANWTEGTTIKSIIYLISRLLASAQDKHVQDRGYILLRTARQLTHKWMREIVDKLQAAVDDDQANELQRRACEMAATCRATFDVDSRDLDALLCSYEDVAILVESTIVVHDNTPLHLGETYPDFQKLLRRDRRLSHALELPLKKISHTAMFRHGMDVAIAVVWPGYRAGTAWEQLAEPNARWLTASSASLSNQRTQNIHYNILDGTLIVDARRLGRLTRDIVEHPTYRRVFCQKILDVIPADLPGMDYATRSTVCGYKVFFALRGSDLVIRAKTSADRTLELIPHRIFLGDIPTLFSTDYAHWMDVHSGVVEFRPLDQLWEESEENWRLNFSNRDTSTLVHGGSETHSMVDIRSTTFKDIAARILPLESSEYLTIIYTDSKVQPGNILIDLPRLRLSFFLSEDGIESKNMQGMVIDDNQCTGTMIGLRNQLVLRNKDHVSSSLPRSRCVLIPRGDVHFSLSPDDNHVRVHIDTQTNLVRQVTWYKYEIDDDIGSLVGNVSLTSRLYRIYLHALCSHSLPDPLTRQRGTDHALQELGSAASFSFQKVTAVDVELLQLIGSIAPRRSYYPKHLLCMQTTEWSANLPAFTQNDALGIAVREILRYADSLNIFSKENVDLDYGCESHSLLISRAMQRGAVYYEEHVERLADMKCNSRDSPHIKDYDSYGIEALKTSRLVYSWPRGLTRRLKSSELLEIFKGWSHMSGPTSQVSLNYTKEWLGLDLPTKWLAIYDLCRQGYAKKFELVFSFAALAYSTPNPQRYIPHLLAFATIPDSFLTPPPAHPLYKLENGFEPLRDKVRGMIVSGRFNMMDSPSGKLSQHANEANKNFRRRRQNHYNDATEQKINYSVDYLMNQWCCCIPTPPFHTANDSEWFRIEKIMHEVTEYFTSCSHNADLLLFTHRIATTLRLNYVDLTPPPGEILKFSFVPKLDILRSDFTVTLENLFSGRISPAPASSIHKSVVLAHENAEIEEHEQSDGTRDVEKLISQFRRSCQSDFAEGYSERLERSRRQLECQKTVILPQKVPSMTVCLEYRDQCQRHLYKFFSAIRSAIDPKSTAEEILMLSGLWPSIHYRTLLSCLASTAEIRLSPEWTEILINFAELLISYQFSQRLVTYAHRLEVDNFYKEFQNASFNWSDARKNPDWLLIQIQGNFITRAVQSEIAHEMIAPSSGYNTVLQLNMGEGKSHVIVPLVAVALANSKKLVRIVVSKPLAGQMFHLLTERISGLANRRVFYLPFSRDVIINAEHIRRIRELFEICARVQGVLVAQPEHILSFRLMVIERILSSVSPLDQSVPDLQKIQTWLTSSSSDVLDESDELLHVRYQLIYTMGEQQPFDGVPDRWTIIQNVLDLMRRHMIQLHVHKEFSLDVELLGGKAYEGEFPHIRLLGSSASEELISRVAEDALNGKLDSLTFVGLSSSPALRAAVLRFIKERNISSDSETYRTVKFSYGTSGFWKGLLLLRGLLAHGILTHVFSRQRWRVDYGLDLGRSLLAVPYRAKDMPTLRSEFGHPDVTICLTCLSYYYGGLTSTQVQECFNLLVKLDNPPLEYETWVRRGGDDIPQSLRLLMGVNTKDIETFTNDVIPKFQHNQATIDFFLSHVVFPKEAKEFASKLGTSGWDLAEKKSKITTGFSGTNDNSDLLPTSVTPTHSVTQLATNAQVLDYLLRPENERYICTKGSSGQPCSVTEFLDLLIREPREVRVLLDVGAQMLEMSNRELVTHWLSLTKEEVAAGVFFDDADQLSVISRDGVIEQLYSSPFYQRLDECIVYLDDAHTRGTDLRLPLYYRAAVTLGPKTTKDRLVQGCMRMRKLGHGQSIIFCAPPEVDKRIRDTQMVAESDGVKIMDVLSWAMLRTCADIEDHMPHWIQQGVDYHNRKTVQFPEAFNKQDIQRLKRAWLQPAARSLDDMYGPLDAESSSLNAARNIPDMHDRLNELGVTVVHDVRMEEEQEREISCELEQERQVERPSKTKLALHHLDEGVRQFVRDGIIPTKPGILFPLMSPFRTVSDTLSPRNPWAKELLCTRDFMTTTSQGREASVLTSYLRPVQWILSYTTSYGCIILVVMSPYEIDLLLQDIRTSKHVRLHMYAPRTTQAMKPFDDLTFYCIPPLPQEGSDRTPPSLDVRCQLNIWGGQLYLDKYETYLRLCQLLGISSSENEEYTFVESDRFVPEYGRVGDMKRICLFDKSPIALLKMLFGLRRKGMSFDQTHMGKILSARLLSPEDFEERPAVI